MCLLFNFCYSRIATFGHKSNRKDKGHPRTGHEDPQVEQTYSCTLSLTSALDRGGRSTPRFGHFTPRKDPVPIVQEAEWAPGPVWTGAENLAPHRDSIPGPSSRQRDAIPTEISRLIILIITVLFRFVAIPERKIVCYMTRYFEGFLDQQGDDGHLVGQEISWVFRSRVFIAMFRNTKH